MAAPPSAAASLKRTLQQQQVRSLYRRSLKNMLSWAIFRDIFYTEVRVAATLCVNPGPDGPAVRAGLFINGTFCSPN